MFRFKSSWLRVSLGSAVLLVYLLISLRSQFSYTINPFKNYSRYIPLMLTKDDIGQLKALAPEVAQAIENINSYPQDTNFYFVPCFEDSRNTGLWWWYFYLLSRYMCYPRKIFCHDDILYHGSKSEYAEKFIGRAKYYQDLPWMQSRHITKFILLRGNTFSIFGPEEEIRI